MKRTAIVILNWNGRRHLETFLPSVVANSCADGVEIVVADNASSDDSLEFLKNNYTGVRIVTLDKNYGFAQGYNLALEQVEAEYYILLNSDVEVTPGWIEPLVSLLEGDNGIAAVAPKIRSYCEPSKFEYAGACGGFIDMLGYPFCRGRILDTTEDDHGQYDDMREIFWATGACMAVRSALFHSHGGFDCDFFAHQEEIDLCWRLRMSGFRIIAEPRSVVYHLGGGTLPADNPHKTYLNFRNNLYMLYKNLSGRSLYPVIAARLLLDGLSALVFLAQGKRKHFDSVWQAHKAFRKSLPSLRAKRREIQQRRVISPSCIFGGSVVLNYFLGNKKFSDLGF